MIDKLKRILKLTAWFTLCSVFVLVILKPFGVQIVSHNGMFALFLDFADMAGIALKTAIKEALSTLHTSGQKKFL